jgi:hypothetical protein
MKKILAALFLITACATNAFGNPYELGVVGGLDYSSYSYGGISPYGFGAGGGAVWTLFPQSTIGFHVSLLEHYLTATQGGGDLKGAATEGAATVNVNFTASGDRGSFGIGYGVESQGGLKCSDGSCPDLPSSTTGFVIEAKDDHGKTGVFGLAQVFVPNDQSRNLMHRIQTFIGIGYQFGQSQ